MTFAAQCVRARENMLKARSKAGQCDFIIAPAERFEYAKYLRRTIA
jgi:hypothetical protein